MSSYIIENIKGDYILEKLSSHLGTHQHTGLFLTNRERTFDFKNAEYILIYSREGWDCCK